MGVVCACVGSLLATDLDWHALYSIVFLIVFVASALYRNQLKPLDCISLAEAVMLSAKSGREKLFILCCVLNSFVKVNCLVGLSLRGPRHVLGVKWQLYLGKGAPFKRLLSAYDPKRVHFVHSLYPFPSSLIV